MTFLSWDAPTLNCNASPLTDLDHYEVPIFRATIIGSMPCSSDSDEWCPIYAKGFERMLTYQSFLVLMDPGLGEIVGWEDVEAIDSAGNSSALCGASP